MNTHEPPVRLTERERTVLEMLAAGYSLPAIAKERGDDEDGKDLGVVLWEAMQKLRAEDPKAAIALAIRGGHIL